MPTTKQRVLMLIGISHSGKSRFAAELLQLGWRVIGGSLSQEICEKQMMDALIGGREIVIDKPNLTLQERSLWFKKVETEFKWRNELHWVALVINTSLVECLAKVQDSDDRVQDEIYRQAEKFEAPNHAEGFHEFVLRTNFESSPVQNFGDAQVFIENSCARFSISHKDLIMSSTNHSELQPYDSARRVLDKKIEIKQGDIVLLFDLNGTLTTHTAQRRSSGSNKLRPGLRHLLKLKERFRLGIFSSASPRTVQTVLRMFAAELGEELFDQNLIFCRDQTLPISSKYARSLGLKPWDTVKPLGRLFSDLRRVVLFDDDEWKAIKGEEHNMVLVPCWDKDRPDDHMVENMVGEILKMLGNMSESQDVRTFTRTLSSSLFNTSKSIDGQNQNNILPLKTMDRDVHDVSSASNNWPET